MKSESILESHLDASLDREMKLESEVYDLKAKIAAHKKDSKMLIGIWFKLDRQIKQSQRIEFLQEMLIKVLERKR